MPLMRGWFTTPRSTSRSHTTLLVKGAAEGWVVGRGEAARGVVSGKSLARPCPGAEGTSADTIVPTALDHKRPAPLVQCCSQTIAGRAWSERRSVIRYGDG